MEYIVIYQGHRIAVEHHLDSMKLTVDSIVYDKVSGLKYTN